MSTTCSGAQFNTTGKYEKLFVAVRVPQTEQNASAKLLFSSLNLLFGDFLVAVVVMVRLSYLIYYKTCSLSQLVGQD